jgi:hypothetical protein
MEQLNKACMSCSHLGVLNSYLYNVMHANSEAILILQGLKYHVDRVTEARFAADDC